MSKKEKKPLNTFLLTGICVATILSIRNWPLSAEYGVGSLLLILIAAASFLVPISLISAELATGWPKKGGIFTWVKEAFGYKAGLASIWFVWISNVVWYPTILSFVAGAITYAFSPELAKNPYVIFSIIVACFWGIIFLNLKGTKVSGLISSLCLLLGTIIPGLLIITFGFIWLATGKPLQMSLQAKDIIPSFSGFKDLVFFSGLLLGFAGMEMPAVHANEVQNPQKSYPRAILFSSLIIISLSVLGTFAVGLMIPVDSISLITAPIDVLAIFLKEYNLSWLVPLLTILIAVGAFGGISTWVVGPSKGLLEAANQSSLPSFLKRKNKKEMPVGILVVQGIIVTTLSLVFIIMPNLDSSFWILTAFTTQLYLIAYILMFITGIYLRYKKPQVQRKYRIPYGNFGMWVTGIIGILSSCFSIFIGFFPPSQIDVGSPIFYFFFLFGGMVLFSLLPFLIKTSKH